MYHLYMKSDLEMMGIYDMPAGKITTLDILFYLGIYLQDFDRDISAYSLDMFWQQSVRICRN